jgi:hypothetical protein
MSTPVHKPWRFYTVTVVQAFVIFTLATFCVGIYFTHRTGNWIMPGIALIGLYLFVIFACIHRVVTRLPVAVLMILVPIAPLTILIIVVSLLPILQKLQ